MIFFILFAMLFCHIIDDYFLQGILASMKQKEWWNKNAPGKMYAWDYIAALFMHSFSWAFMIMLPIAIVARFQLGLLFLAYPINTVIHCVIDDLKANKHKINLIIDQSIHIIQILITWAIFAFR